MLSFFLQGVVLGLAGGAQPGPLQAWLMSRSLADGWRRALPAIAAPLITDGPVILLALLVLQHLPNWWQSLLSMAGGLFVLCLAWDAWRGLGQGSGDTPPPDPTQARRTVMQAVLTNLLSPSPYLFWSLVGGPILLRGWRETPASGIGFILGFYLALIPTLAFIVFAFGTAGRRGPRLQRSLQAIAVIVLAGFGVMLLWWAWRGGVGG